MDVETTSTSNSAPEQQAPTPKPTKTARVDRDTLLAELEAGAHEKPGDKAAPPKPEPKEEPAEEAAEEQVDAEEDEQEEKPAAAEEEGAEEEDEGPELDAATAKRIAAVQRQEKRFREQMAKDRAELEKIATEWKPKIEAAAKFEQLKSRAKYAPDAVLEALGLGPDDFEPAARLLYAKSQAGQKDPKNREAAERMARERESNDQLAATRRELEELKQQFQAREQQAKTQAAVADYLDKVTKAVSVAETPLVARMLDKTPKKTRTKLHEIAVELAEETGEAPDPMEVIALLEARRQEELEELGIDPTTVLGAAESKSESKPKTAPQGKGPAKTLTRTGAGPTAPRGKAKSRDEEFADLRRELETGKFES